MSSSGCSCGGSLCGGSVVGCLSGGQAVEAGSESWVGCQSAFIPRRGIPRWGIQRRDRQRRGRQRQGLSLLELLVVLTIMIALGGIVVSTLPGLLERTQVATAAANVPQIDSSIRQNSIIRQGRLGDRFDALVIGSSSLDGAVPSYLGGAANFQTTSITAGEVFALQRLGITELIPAVEKPGNATFDSHDQLPVKLSPESKLCAINLGTSIDLVRRLWNIEPPTGAKYVVFGIGARSTLVGASKDSLFSEAPVHFSDNQLTNPKAMYSRYLIVIELVPDGEAAAAARYVGTCAPGTTGLSSISQILQKHYNGKF